MNRLKEISILAAIVIAVPLAASAGNDTDKKTKDQVTSDHKLDNDPKWSNWPHLPERQGGSAYSKRTRIEYGGPVERNFESGRR